MRETNHTRRTLRLQSHWSGRREQQRAMFTTASLFTKETEILSYVGMVRRRGKGVRHGSTSPDHVRQHRVNSGQRVGAGVCKERVDVGMV